MLIKQTSELLRLLLHGASLFVIIAKNKSEKNNCHRSLELVGFVCCCCCCCILKLISSTVAVASESPIIFCIQRIIRSLIDMRDKETYTWNAVANYRTATVLCSSG